MGLDSVELIMVVEDRFRTKLADDECSRVRTVADLAALVISRLRGATAFCPTARVFFSVRKTLTQDAGVDRRTLRPTTPLAVVFPREKRRSRWKSLARVQPYLPRLGLTEAAQRTFYAAGLFLLLLWVIALVPLIIKFGVWGGVVSVVTLCCGVVAFRRVRESLSNEFPAGCATLGDLVRTITPEAVPSEGSPRLLVEQRIIEQIQIITAEELGLPREKVTLHSRFAEDLGMG